MGFFHFGRTGTIKPRGLPPGTLGQLGQRLTSDVQGVEGAGVPLVPALQLPDEGERRAEQPVGVLAAPQEHRPRVGVQVLHCGGTEAPVSLDPRAPALPRGAPPRGAGRRGQRVPSAPVKEMEQQARP